MLFEVGTPCDDYDEITENDRCQLDGTCKGVIPPCYGVECDSCQSCLDGVCVYDDSADSCEQCYTCAPSCADVEGWTDTAGFDCAGYVTLGLCGSSMQSNFVLDGGLTADDACCACGGGNLVESTCVYDQGASCDDGDSNTGMDTCGDSPSDGCTGTDCDETCPDGT